MMLQLFLLATELPEDAVALWLPQILWGGIAVLIVYILLKALGFFDRLEE